MSPFLAPRAHSLGKLELFGHRRGNFSNHAGNFTSSDGEDSSQSSRLEHLLLELVAKTSQEHRQAVLITTAFSIAASMLVMYSITRDAYKVKDGEAYSAAQRRLGIFRTLHPAEVFPFITALAVVIQGAVFLGTQGAGYNSFKVPGCKLTAELVWPSLWIVSLVILVFSVEMTFRSLCKVRFRVRGKWETPSYIALTALLLLGLWLSAFLMPSGTVSDDICIGSLMWWTGHYSRLGVVIAPGIILTHGISAALISVQLWKTVEMDPNERIAASRVVYSLGVNTLVLAFVMPFWIQVEISGPASVDHFRDISKVNDASKIAEIAITLSGLLHSALYTVLRPNAERLAIRPRATPWSAKRKIRIFGPNDLNVGMFISTPLLAHQEEMTGWDKSMLKDKPAPVPNSTSPRPTLSPTTSLTQPAKPFPQKHRAKSSYSIFPTATTSIRVPPSVWLADRSLSTPTNLQPLSVPEPLFAFRHTRNASTITSATVEIGLRLSHAIPGMRPSMDTERPSEASSINNNDNNSKNSLSNPASSSFLNLPLSQINNRASSPTMGVPITVALTPSSQTQAAPAPKFTSPKFQQREGNSSLRLRTSQQEEPSSLSSSGPVSPWPQTSPVTSPVKTDSELKRQMNKSLPPTPAARKDPMLLPSSPLVIAPPLASILARDGQGPTNGSGVVAGTGATPRPNAHSGIFLTLQPYRPRASDPPSYRPSLVVSPLAPSPAGSPWPLNLKGERPERKGNWI